MSKLDELQKSIDGMLAGRWVVDLKLLSQQAREAQEETTQQSVQARGGTLSSRRVYALWRLFFMRRTR